MLSDRKFPRLCPSSPARRSRRSRPSLDSLEDRRVPAANPALGYAVALGGVSPDNVQAVAADAAGNVYATGFFKGTVDFDPGLGTTNLAGTGFVSSYAAKYDNAGNLVWANPVFATGDTDSGNAIAVSSTGDVYVAGTFTGSADFGGGVTLPGGSGPTLYLAHYSPAGKIVSATQVTGTNLIQDQGIAVDASNNVYLTGFFAGTVDFDPTAGTANITAPGGGSQGFIMKLNSGGTLGFAKTYGASGFAANAFAVSVDAAGNVYGTGTFRGTADFGSGFVLNSGTDLNNPPNVKSDAFVIKLDPAGNTIWATAPGGTGQVRGFGLAVDPAGNVYSSGFFDGTSNFNPGGAAASPTSSLQDAYIWKLDSAGHFVWVRQFGGASNDASTGLALDSAGNVYASGFFSGTATLTNGPSLTATGDIDTFVLKLDPAGGFAWATHFGGAPGTQNAPTAAQSNTVAVSPLGSVIVAGAFTNTVNFDPGPTTTNRTSHGAADAYIVKLTSSAVTIDNHDAGYAETGTWNTAGGGLNGDYRFAASSGTPFPTSTATWSATGLTPGTYDVGLTWVPFSNRATNAQFIIYDGATVVGRVTVDQTKAPTGTTSGGATFQSLGAFPTASGILRVAVGNNANNFVIADAVRIAPPTATPALVDNDSPVNYAETGTWTTVANRGGNNQDYRFAAPGNGSTTAAWTTSGLATGFYDVQATWTPFSNRATNAPYSIFDGTKLLATVSVNQQLAPVGVTSNGVTYQSLGVFRSTTGTLRVVLGNNANGFVVADAARITTASTGPVNVDNDDPAYSTTGAWTTVANRGGVNNDYLFAAPTAGAAPTATSTWSTPGLAPGAYTVLATWAPFTNRASDAPYRIFDGNKLVATIRVDQRINPQGTSIGGTTYQTLGAFQIDSGSLRVVLGNDANNFVIADSVFVQTATFVEDNSDPTNYVNVPPAAWTTAGGGGINGDYRFAAAGNGSSTAVWKVDVPTPGASYNVQVTWVPFFNRATNATYQVFDGNILLASVVVNQQVSPTGPLYNGIPFQSLGVYSINSGQVRVVLTNNANGFVIADAIKVDYINVGGNIAVP